MPQEYLTRNVVNAQAWSIIVGYVDILLVTFLFVMALLFVALGLGDTGPLENAIIAGGPTFALGVALVFFGQRISIGRKDAQRSLYILVAVTFINITTGLYGVTGQFPYGVAFATAICVGLEFFYFLAIKDLLNTPVEAEAVPADRSIAP